LYLLDKIKTFYLFVNVLYRNDRGQQRAIAAGSDPSGMSSPEVKGYD